MFEFLNRFFGRSKLISDVPECFTPPPEEGDSLSVWYVCKTIGTIEVTKAYSDHFVGRYHPGEGNSPGQRRLALLRELSREIEDASGADREALIEQQKELIRTTTRAIHLPNIAGDIKAFSIHHSGQVEVGFELWVKEEKTLEECTKIYPAGEVEYWALIGNLAAVEGAIEEGHDVNASRDNGYTALHAAANNNHPEVVKCLLENGAIVDAKMDDGTTALNLASEYGFDEVVDVLQNGRTSSFVGKLVSI